MSAKRSVKPQVNVSVDDLVKAAQVKEEPQEEASSSGGTAQVKEEPQEEASSSGSTAQDQEEEEPQALTEEEAAAIMGAMEKWRKEAAAARSSVRAALAPIFPAAELDTMIAKSLQAQGFTLTEEEEEAAILQKWPRVAEAAAIMAVKEAAADPRKWIALQAEALRATEEHSAAVAAFTALDAKWHALIGAWRKPEGSTLFSAFALPEGFTARLDMPSRKGSSGKAQRAALPSMIKPGIHLSAKTPGGFRIVVRASFRKWRVEYYVDEKAALTINGLARVKPIYATEWHAQGGSKSLNAAVNEALQEALKASGRKPSETRLSLPTHVYGSSEAAARVYVSGAADPSAWKEAVTEALQGKEAAAARLLAQEASSDYYAAINVKTEEEAAA